MRYIASPVFTEKLSIVDSADIQGVASFLKFVEDSSDKEEILGGQQNVVLLEEDIFLFSKQPIYVYFTFGEDDGGEYVLLLDITIQQTRTGIKEMFTMKNPKTNSSLNPYRNSSLNPHRNSSLNPHRNSSLNPYRNSSINPYRNSSINPHRNSSINPYRNSSINPYRNSSINPYRNSSINPYRNSSFSGSYLYNDSLRQIGYLVKANELVELVFESLGDFSGILVHANTQVRCHFNKSNDWIGYVVQANEDVALRFNTDGTWIGMII